MRLHPTMVRLQRRSGRSLFTQAGPISIPLWFDCNVSEPLAYLYTRGDLHPTMVRLQLQEGKREKSTRKGHLHPTMVRLQLASRKSRPGMLPFSISIPLWFDCNPRAGNMQKRQKDISIPLWFDCNTDEEMSYKDFVEISIPLWFDCNRR